MLSYPSTLSYRVVSSITGSILCSMHSTELHSSVSIFRNLPKIKTEKRWNYTCLQKKKRDGYKTNICGVVMHITELEIHLHILVNKFICK